MEDFYQNSTGYNEQKTLQGYTLDAPSAPSYSHQDVVQEVSPQSYSNPVVSQSPKPIEYQTTPPQVQSDIDMNSLLHFMVEKDASDLHISVGVPPIARQQGKLLPIPGMPVITPQLAEKLIGSILSDDQKKKYEKELELDYSYPFKDLARFRVNAFRQKAYCSAALRKIPTQPVPLEDLHLPSVITKLSELSKGLIIVTGPTGSGKSTTLAAIIDRINRHRNEHIITIEDPIEFQHSHKKSIVQQREVGEDTTTFAKALKSVLRQDPDVVLIGEMRDLETISAAISTAETGHLVFGTLHTNTAPSSIDRMIDVFPPHQQQQIRMQLSSSLQAVISQRLVPNLQGTRTCVMEILIVNSAIRNLIREGKTHQIESMMISGRGEGMQLFDSTLTEYVKKGQISFEVALGYANDQKQFSESCGKR